MAQQSNSCQYIFSDVQKPDLPLIHGSDVSTVFDGKVLVTAVNRVSFGIEEGKITAIIGESGSGKSTLLKLIYGLLEPSTGEVRYRGWLVPTRKDKLIPGHDAMKLVSQGFDDLNLYAKVWDNVASQLSNTNLELKAKRTQEVLEQLRIDHLAQKRVADLSGGEKQRVAISRALINDPEVLLMDEPFNQVDAAFRDELQQDIQNIVARTGLTVILVSHDPAEVLAMSDYLLVMKAGEIADYGKPKELYSKPNTPYTARLLAKSNILSANKAKVLGIDTGSLISILQEDINIESDDNGSFWIKDIKFRGFYNELIVGNDNLTLHTVQFPKTEIKKNTRIKILVSSYHSFK
ncbi:ABC transporter ATP-binding protein [Sphingobacterium daejeonense]|uniref:ABC transporter ATP-binding protein n=1 Tax=Sphingobacterium daejeonense TaxID=371142 RepID=UPI0021A46DC2|nr:ABC transporter ATP-binding protein [Sphingobacterium daejeonense]MCT1530822.1 ABC transporter ATP-binding protein [Sphingobacterium daejeonense]